MIFHVSPSFEQVLPKIVSIILSCRWYVCLQYIDYLLLRRRILNWSHKKNVDRFDQILLRIWRRSCMPRIGPILHVLTISCQKIMSINCLSLLLNEWQLWWAPPLWCSPPLTPAACCCSSTSRQAPIFTWGRKEREREREREREGNYCKIMVRRQKRESYTHKL